MTKSKKTLKLIKDILHEKCPQCDNRYAFMKKSGIIKFPEMHKYCPACEYRFEREPGYFIGAMYISYGLAVLLGLPTFVILHYSFPSLSLIENVSLVICLLILFSFKNFKWSRLIYLRIFP